MVVGYCPGDGFGAHQVPEIDVSMCALTSATIPGASAKSPCSCFEKTSVPSTATSKMPPSLATREVSTPRLSFRVAAKLAALGR